MEEGLPQLMAITEPHLVLEEAQAQLEEVLQSTETRKEEALQQLEGVVLPVEVVVIITDHLAEEVLVVITIGPLGVLLTEVTDHLTQEVHHLEQQDLRVQEVLAEALEEEAEIKNLNYFLNNIIHEKNYYSDIIRSNLSILQSVSRL